MLASSTSAVLPPDPASIRRVCVIGAGTMGGGIAAHLANLGFEVTLLDVDRAACEVAFARTRAAKPSPFTGDWSAQSIRLGGIESDADAISDADWVIEAVVERSEIKRELYRRIEPLLGPQSLLSTNTSGLEIGMLAEALTPGVRPRFLGTHFFNPPRYLKLLELIPHAGTDPTFVETYRRLLEEHVARRVVLAKDTPGFIANRFGMWSIYLAIHCAERLQLSIEDTDAITGVFLGRPRSGTFRLADVIGLDVMADIAQNLISRVPNDPQVRALQPPRSLSHLLAKGSIGEKVGHGYTNREGQEFLVLDLTTYAYRPRRDVALARFDELSKLPLAERLKMGIEGRDVLGDFLRMYLPPLLNYAQALREEISHSVEDFDRVMRWGFGWSHGPFELADLLGASPAFYRAGEQLAPDGSYGPLASEPEFRSASDFPVLVKGETLVLRDFGDGVVGIGFATKMGTITRTLVSELTEFLRSSDGPFVLYPEGKAFSAGYDLAEFLQLIEGGDLADVEARLVALQELGELLESKRTVAAVSGYCLGAGFELAASCGRIVADAEARIGLPEAKVGLLPGGRGTALMRVRAQTSNAPLVEMALELTKGTISDSADHARRIGYLRVDDRTEYHPDRLITTAIAAARETGSPREAWQTLVGPANGRIDAALDSALKTGVITDYDVVIGHRIKAIFTKTTSFDEAVARERKEFLELCHRAQTTARIQHMLSTGKPLRN